MSRRSLTRKSLLTILFLGISLGILEVSLRMIGPEINLSHNWRYHRELGWSQIPGVSYDFELEGERVHIEFNALGFRDEEHSKEKPSGTKRVVVLGDSFSEAVQVNLEQTYFRKLERLLDESSHYDWETINLGVGDFGTAQALLALERFGWDYSPDLVLYQMFPLNDICNNSIELFGLCKSPNDVYRPYFVERDGTLILTSAQPVRNFLRRRSVAYRVCERAFWGLFPSEEVPVEEPERAQYLAQRGFPPLEPLLYTYVDEPDMIEPVANGWHITERMLEQLVRTCRERGVPLLTVVVPFHIRVGKVWQQFASFQPPPAMIQDYPERRLHQLFGRLDSPLLLLKPVFEADLSRFLIIDGHFKPEAHEVAAEAIFEKLVDMELSDPIEAVATH